MPEEADIPFSGQLLRRNHNCKYIWQKDLQNAQNSISLR